MSSSAKVLQAAVMVRILAAQVDLLASCIAVLTAGMIIEISRARIAIITSSSIRVNPGATFNATSLLAGAGR